MPDPKQMFLWAVCALVAVIGGMLIHAIIQSIRRQLQRSATLQAAKIEARRLLIETRRANLGSAVRQHNKASLFSDLKRLMDQHGLTAADLGPDASQAELERLGLPDVVVIAMTPEIHDMTAASQQMPVVNISGARPIGVTCVADVVRDQQPKPAPLRRF